MKRAVGETGGKDFVPHNLAGEGHAAARRLKIADAKTRQQPTRYFAISLRTSFADFATAF